MHSESSIVLLCNLNLGALRGPQISPLSKSIPSFCWCSFLESRPVCVTTASAAPVQGQAEASRLLRGGRDAGWERPRVLPRPAIQPDRSTSETPFRSICSSTCGISLWKRHGGGMKSGSETAPNLQTYAGNVVLPFHGVSADSLIHGCWWCPVIITCVNKLLTNEQIYKVLTLSSCLVVVKQNLLRHIQHLSTINNRDVEVLAKGLSKRNAGVWIKLKVLFSLKSLLWIYFSTTRSIRENFWRRRMVLIMF